MKSITFLSTTILLFLFSCSEEKPIALDYCEILKTDQSHLGRDSMDREKRKKIIHENFDQLIAFSKQNGFPKVSFYDFPFDSCKYWAVSATLIHIVQTKPDLFFEKKTVDFFKTEMDKGNLTPGLLFTAGKVSSISPFCEKLKPEVEYASELWNLEKNPFKDFKFKKCE